VCGHIRNYRSQVLYIGGGGRRLGLGLGANGCRLRLFYFDEPGITVGPDSATAPGPRRTAHPASHELRSDLVPPIMLEARAVTQPRVRGQRRAGSFRDYAA